MDRTTGLTLGLPQDWQRVENTAVDLVLVHNDPARPAGMFQPNLVATVVPVAPDVDVARFTEQTTLAWLDATPTGHVAAVDLSWMDGQWGRRVLASYSDRASGVTLNSYCFVQAGLGTRIDISCGIWNTDDALRAAPEMLGGFVAPKTYADAAAVDRGERTSVVDYVRGLLRAPR
ncbi:hypothetical protein [Salinibacterium sp. ZJ454]|uniref:hypothetical protein n=1 Tax=Salinibacterium sp. ZJ454 TaxID=2708339 RepID=UPI00141F10B2|nr:hypothetical protein [Salinibacterium sp. ZJ454]